MPVQVWPRAPIIMDFSIQSFVKVTEKAAFASYPSIGKEDPHQSDQLAVSAMREAFNCLPIDIQIVIGEGERDQAPRLYTGEQLGNPQSSSKWDIAVDPLEGTNLCAKALPGAIAVLAAGLRNTLFKAPDIYMKKIASGPQAKHVIDLQAPVKDNLQKTAQALGKKVEELKVGVLDRSRHQKLIESIQAEKAKVHLVGDGDIALSLQVIYGELDLLMGTGGAPEGVLSAVAGKCLEGGFQGQLVYQNSEERERASSVGVQELDKVWNQEELVKGPAYFVATGITTGPILEGIKKEKDFYSLQSLVLSPNKGFKKINSKLAFP